MASKKTCPLLNQNCLRIACEWWLDGASRCAIALVPGGLEEIFKIIDRK